MNVRAIMIVRNQIVDFFIFLYCDRRMRQSVFQTIKLYYVNNLNEVFVVNL